MSDAMTGLMLLEAIGAASTEAPPARPKTPDELERDDAARRVAALVQLWLAIHGGDPSPELGNGALGLVLIEMAAVLEDEAIADELRKVGRSVVFRAIEAR